MLRVEKRVAILFLWDSAQCVQDHLLGSGSYRPFGSGGCIYPNFVRSWCSSGVSGRIRQLMSGLWPHCESTDLQVSRLHDVERCHPWDQLLIKKKGLTETHNVFDRMLSGESAQVPLAPVDEYRSNVCAQLESLEKSLVIPRLPGKFATKVSPTRTPKNSGVVSANDVTLMTLLSQVSGVVQSCRVPWSLDRSRLPLRTPRMWVLAFHRQWETEVRGLEVRLLSLDDADIWWLTFR